MCKWCSGHGKHYDCHWHLKIVHDPHGVLDFLLYWIVHKYVADPQHGPLSVYNLLKGPLMCKIGFLFLMVQPRMVFIHGQDSRSVCKEALMMG